MWRVEVREPDTMVEAWFTHENLSAILGTDSHDPVIIGKLVQWRRDEIQECISIAATEHWPDELGIRPEEARFQRLQDQLAPRLASASASMLLPGSTSTIR
jgi:hypothetical protein